MTCRFLPALCVIAAVAGAAPAMAASVTGTVNYRERIALPAASVLRIELRDVSRQDAPAPLIASIDMRLKRQAPIPYRLRYDPDRIDPAHLYSVSARIMADGRLAFISTRINAVITRGAGTRADILLQPVGHAPR